MPKLSSALLAPTVCFVLLLAACAGQKDPAQKYMAQIHTVLMAASAEAAKYVPDQLADVQTKFIDLQGSYDKKDYQTVVSRAPAVLQAAEQLATTAAGKKDEVLKKLNDDWTNLAARVPAEIDAVQQALAAPAKKLTKKSAPPGDVTLARTDLAQALSFWSKAQAGFAAGNLEEAVSTGHQVEDALGAAAQAGKFELPAR